MVEEGEDHPAKLAISQANSAGIVKLDDFLRLNNSFIADDVEITARIEGETGRRILELQKPHKRLTRHDHQQNRSHAKTQRSQRQNP